MVALKPLIVISPGVNQTALFLGVWQSDGSMSIYWSKDKTCKTGLKLEGSLTITQKVDYPLLLNMRPIMINSIAPTGPNKNGNLVLNSWRKVKVALDVLFVDTEMVYACKRIDLLILSEVRRMVDNKEHLNLKGIATIIDLREATHGDSKPDRARRSDYEKEFQLKPNSSVGLAAPILKRIRLDEAAHSKRVISAMIAGTCVVNPYFCTGIFIGDGSLMLICGQRRIFPVLTLTTSLVGYLPHEVAMYGILGYRLVGRDSLVTNSHCFAMRTQSVIIDKVIPHLEKYPLLPGKKQQAVALTIEGVKELRALKDKKVRTFSEFSAIVSKFYLANATRKLETAGRKFPTADAYLASIRETFESGKFLLL
jgi:hypothetical protein